jgi:hypothetical protein
MRVRIDAEQAPQLKRTPVPAPIKVQSIGIAINLNGNAVLGARHEIGVHVCIIARPAQELPSGWMAEDCCEGIGNGGYDSLRLLSSVQLEAGVHAGDNEVEALQHLRRIIERSIGKDVGLDAFENAKAPAIAAVEFIRHGVLRFDLFKG